MNIKVLFTKASGVIVGDVTEHPDGWLVESPAQLVPTRDGVSIAPLILTQLTEEKAVLIAKQDVMFSGVYTPLVEIRNQYSAIMGSGIQLLA